MTLFIHRNLPQKITVMIINTGQMGTVNYSGRPRMCDLKCPDWKKKCVVGLVYYKKKGKHTAYQEITFFCFLQLLIMYCHFLNLISQDFWCPHLFVSADITVPVYTSKSPPSSDHIFKLNINICTLS